MPDNKAAINQTVFLNPGETVYIVSVLTNQGSYLWGLLFIFRCRDPPTSFGPFHAEEAPRHPPVVDLRPPPRC